MQSGCKQPVILHHVAVDGVTGFCHEYPKLCVLTYVIFLCLCSNLQRAILKVI